MLALRVNLCALSLYLGGHGSCRAENSEGLPLADQVIALLNFSVGREPDPPIAMASANG